MHFYGSTILFPLFLLILKIAQLKKTPFICHGVKVSRSLLNISYGSSKLYL